MKKRRLEVGNRVQDRDQRTGTIEAIVGSSISVRWDDDGTLDDMKKAELTKLAITRDGSEGLDETPENLDETDDPPLSMMP
jgi:hypothetical protein